MASSMILSHLCTAEFSPGDAAHLVAWSNGQFGIVRNGQPVAQERWDRAALPECGKAFLHYVRLIRRKTLRENANRPAA
jgi:hypothetical protein